MCCPPLLPSALLMCTAVSMYVLRCWVNEWQKGRERDSEVAEVAEGEIERQDDTDSISIALDCKSSVWSSISYDTSSYLYAVSTL